MHVIIENNPQKRITPERLNEFSYHFILYYITYYTDGRYKYV